MNNVEKIKKVFEEGMNKIFNYKVSSEELEKYLDFCSKMYMYSFKNQILLYSQGLNDSTKLLGFKEINKLGYRLNKGSRAYKIFAPVFKKKKSEKEEKEEKDENVLSGFFVVNVFDIRDTNIPEDEYPELIISRSISFENEGNLDTIFEKLEELSKDIGVKSIVKDEMRHSTRGYFDLEKKIIALNKNNTQSQDIKTAIHELAHAYLHKKEDVFDDSKRGLLEFQAEMVSYIVSSYLGLKVENYSIQYIHSWISKRNDIEGNTKAFSEIQKTAKFFIDEISKDIKDISVDAS